MKNKFFTNIHHAIALPVIAGILLLTAGFPHVARAASLTGLSDTMSSSKISTASSHVIKFTTPTGTNVAGQTIIVTFPSDFNLSGKVIGSVTFTHGASTGLETTETLAGAATAAAWGAAFSGTQNRIFTLTTPTDGIGAAALAPNDKVILTFTSANAINPTTAASFSIDISGTFGDTGSILINTLTDDQVQVSATVPQSLTFSISDNTIGFGALNSAAARYATGDTNGNAAEIEAHNIIVGTNAANGYTMSLNGSTLTYGAFTVSAIGAANTASSVGTEQFGMRMTATGGTGAVVAPYAAAGFALDTAAFPDQVASAAGSTANTTYSVRYLANITSATEAGSYAATLTYTATANF